MIIPKIKLKNQLALVNTFSKLMIIVLAVFIIPWLVRNISINETDNQLIEKLDIVYELIEEKGIEEFINTEQEDIGFGSYNILKEEYISIEESIDTVLNEYIDNSQRIIEDHTYDYRVISAIFQYDSKFYLIEIGKSINSIFSFESKLKEFAFYFLLVLLSLTVLFDLSVTQILLRPFDQIIQKLKHSDHPTKFDYQPIATKTSDFIYLEESIHALMHKIETAFQSEREFIGDISHEILTPISIIRSKLDNFANSTELSDDETIKIMESKMTLGRLTKLVRTLLLMSRIDNQEYLINEQVDLNKMLHTVLDEMSDRFEIKQLKLNYSKQTTKTIFKANRELLHILFFNLISNAIKYTPEKGEISVGLLTKENSFEIYIRDTGIGINSLDLPHIFTRFKKFQKGENNFGLGLSIAKRIADNHELTIQVVSQQNSGTQFTVTGKH